MDTKTTGGPAFPNDYNLPENQGMTMRDYFAAQVMPVVVSEVELMRLLLGGEADVSGQEALSKVDSVAFMSFLIADAMLKARGNS